MSRKGLLGGLAAAAACLAQALPELLQSGPTRLFNDFDIYWGQAWMLNHGLGAYDKARLGHVLHAAGVRPVLGTGYSYPLFFAELLRPLALLRPTTAALLFMAISLAGLGVGTAILVDSLPATAHPGALLVGAATGLFSPVAGSLTNGQANLILLPFYALAFRSVVPGLALGVAAAVKLYPVAGFAALAVAGPRGRRQMAVGVLLMAALVLLPQLLSPGGTGYPAALRVLGDVDPYFLNVTVNGFLSRLARPRVNSTPPFPGLPVHEIEYVIEGVLVALVLVVLWRARGRSYAGSLALAIGVATVGGVKNTLWNFTPLLLCAFFAAPLLRRRPGPATLLWLGLLLVEVQRWLQPPLTAMYQAGFGVAAAGVSSLALYGGLLVVAATAVALLSLPRPAPAPPPSPPR